MLTILVLVAIASISYAGGPLPGPKKGGPTLVGKSVDGQLNSIVVFSGEVVQYIVLFCDNSDIVLGPVVDQYSTNADNLADTTAECLSEEDTLCIEGLKFGDVFSPTNNPDPALEACFPEADGFFNNDLFITRVKNFTNTGVSISADVALQAGQE
jgi:hypothetical protein